MAAKCAALAAVESPDFIRMAAGQNRDERMVRWRDPLESARQGFGFWTAAVLCRFRVAGTWRRGGRTRLREKRSQVHRHRRVNINIRSLTPSAWFQVFIGFFLPIGDSKSEIEKTSCKTMKNWFPEVFHSYP
jgi:hypothetical protein